MTRQVSDHPIFFHAVVPRSSSSMKKSSAVRFIVSKWIMLLTAS